MGKHARDDIDQGQIRHQKKPQNRLPLASIVTRSSLLEDSPPPEEMRQELANDKAAAKKTRSYKFCILNEVITRRFSRSWAIRHYEDADDYGELPAV
ncbi:hypothetical protein GQ600_433 [Phytophthora cactorum]|nr:hypothetical protein GQ600_433 [Phytophthora cactorum]